jgi:hypothetical protein
MTFIQKDLDWSIIKLIEFLLHCLSDENKVTMVIKSVVYVLRVPPPFSVSAISLALAEKDHNVVAQ